MADVWARIHHVEMELNRRDKRTRDRATQWLKSAASGNGSVLWDRPDIAEYTLPKREELHELSRPFGTGVGGGREIDPELPAIVTPEGCQEV